MPKPERLQYITAREAISEIVDAVVKQKGAGGEELGKLKSFELQILDGFGVGDVRIERTIFTADTTISKEKIQDRAILNNVNKSQKIIESKDRDSQVSTLLREASAEKPLSKRFLAEKILGEATYENLEAMGYFLLKAVKKLTKSGEIIRQIPLKKDPERPWGPRAFGYYIVKKDKQVAEDSPAKTKTTLNVRQKNPEAKTIAPKSVSRHEAAAITVPIVSKSPNAENKPISDLPLKDSEIFVVLERILSMMVEDKQLLASLNINTTQLFDKDEIKSLMNRVRGDIDRRRMNKKDFEKENLSSFCNKLDVFMKDRQKYLNSCRGTAKILLDCFGSEKADKAFFEKLLEPQPVLVRKTMAEMEV
jgi:hypothetical protein